jgi:DNA modification methylase
MLILADARHIPLRDGCVQCCISSPPYFGLRDYGHAGQIGLEASPETYVAALVDVFREVRRVLADDGVLWLNLGDSYNAAAVGSFNGGGFKDSSARSGGRDLSGVATSGVMDKLTASGLPPKNLLGIPWRVAFALQADGWYLRSDVIWSKPNPMPESVTDRPTKSHEYLFLLTKSERYFYDADAIAEPVSASMLAEMAQGYDGLGLKDYDAAGVQNPSSVKARIIANAQRKNEQSGDRRKVGFNDRWDAKERSHAKDLSVALPMADSVSSSERRLDDQVVRPDDPRGNEYEGKHGTAHSQSASRRMLLNAKAARDDGAPHDAPFGLTRNKRTVWTVNTQPYSGSHFATMPEKLVEPCILAGSRLGDLVYDPFIGSGTVGAVAERLARRWVGTDLSYQHLAKKRTAQRGLRFEEASA